MPQLHDSGSRAIQPSDQTHQHDFARIFGIETEYGVSVTDIPEPMDASHVAMTMFQPVVRRARSTNTYVENGSRLYLDVGSHPEYATAEAICPSDALLSDLAGEQIMRSMGLDAQRRLRESGARNRRATLHLYKNNADSAGHSFGCHENYLVRRFVNLDMIQHVLLPFLITRQIYTGAGRFDGERLLFTQRAAFVDETVSSATTRSRPMINTRDEPHANPEDYRRLHVIIGDSNRSQWATLMKCATTHLVLCMMEHAAHSGCDGELEAFALADPIAANHAINADGPHARIALASGRSTTALELQQRMLEQVETFAAHHGDALGASLRYDALCNVEWIVGQWRWILDRLAANDIETLSHVIDWASKQMFFDRLRLRGTVTPSRLRQLDLDYHDIANGRLYPSLCAHGLMRTLVDADQIRAAVSTPPPHTRAVLRGRFVATASHTDAVYDCDWTTLKLVRPVHMEAVLLDPFRDEPTKQYDELMGELRDSREDGDEAPV